LSDAHHTEKRTTTSAATLRTTVAIPATSMLVIRLDAMRHFWWQSGGSIDLDHVRRPVAPCDRPAVNVSARSVAAIDIAMHVAI
jgi:hypothetical protein